MQELIFKSRNLKQPPVSDWNGILLGRKRYSVKRDRRDSQPIKAVREFYDSNFIASIHRTRLERLLILHRLRLFPYRNKIDI
jgi:hypothetical protein